MPEYNKRLRQTPLYDCRSRPPGSNSSLSGMGKLWENCHLLFRYFTCRAPVGFWQLTGGSAGSEMDLYRRIGVEVVQRWKTVTVQQINPELAPRSGTLNADRNNILSVRAPLMNV